MGSRRALVPEPPVAQGILGPGVLAGIVMVCVYAAAGAMLGAVAVTASPGPETAGGPWDVLVWAVSVALAAAAARPVLRRTAHRRTVGAAGGLLLALSYGGLAIAFEGAGALGPTLVLELLAMVVAGSLAGVGTGDPPQHGDDPDAADMAGP